MNRASRTSLQVVACLALAAFAVTGLAACGDEEEEQKLTYSLSGNGKAAEFSGPTSADSGLAEISFDNESDGDGDMQLIWVEGDRSAAEVTKGFEAASNGKPFPEWLFAGGGPGAVGPGESGTVTQVLEPGTYYAFEVEGNVDPEAAIALEVSGDASDESLEADATVEAFDYGFKTDGIASGENEVVFTNTGDEPHHILYTSLRGDSTAEDVVTFLKTEKGKPPFDEENVKSTAVIEGGEEQLVTLDMEPGRYALLCFISDRQGGPPHAFKGMVDEVEVEE